MDIEEKYNFCYNDCPFRKIRFVDRYIVNDCQKADIEQPPDSCPKEVNHGITNKINSHANI